MADNSFNIGTSEIITPSDTVDLINKGRGLLVDTAGTVKVTYEDGSIDTVTLTAGFWHPMRPTRVWTTGTAVGIHIGW